MSHEDRINLRVTKSKTRTAALSITQNKLINVMERNLPEGI